MKTTLAKDPGADRAWFVLDAEGQALGRISVKIADILRGKNKPTFTPHVDTGDFVVIINAEKVKLSGKKEEMKLYRSYSGWRGGLKEKTAASVRERHPERLIQHAVKGMLPKNNLSRQMFSRLKVYAGEVHPHDAQQPQAV